MSTRRGLRRFTMAEAADIRRAARTRTNVDIAREYGVDKETIGRIVRGITYTRPYRNEPRGKPQTDCPCPSCVRASRPLEDYDEAPATLNLNPGQLRAIALVAREFDSASIRCPWHRAILLIGQRCPFCEYVRVPTTAQDFADYLDVARREIA